MFLMSHYAHFLSKKPWYGTYKESTPSNAVTADDNNTNVAEQEGKGYDIRYNDRNHNEEEREGNREEQKDGDISQGVSAAHGELPSGEETHDLPHRPQRLSEVDGIDDRYGRAGDEPGGTSQHVSPTRRDSKQRDLSATSNGDRVNNNYGNNGNAVETGDCDFGHDIRSRVKEARSSTRSGEKGTRRCRSDAGCFPFDLQREDRRTGDPKQRAGRAGLL